MVTPFIGIPLKISKNLTIFLYCTMWQIHWIGPTKTCSEEDGLEILIFAQVVSGLIENRPNAASDFKIRR